MMGPTNVMTKKAKCTAAITTPYTIAKFGADDHTLSVAAAATDGLIGIFQHTTSAANETVEVAMAGNISNIKLGGSVTRGDPLTSDASGQGITASLGQSIIGYALASGVSGDIKPCLVMPQIYAPNQGVDGLTLKGVARATYDFAEHGGDVGAISLGVTIPDNAVITRGYWEVITAFVSESNDGTIALHVQSAGDLLAAVDPDGLSEGSLNELIPDGTAAAMIKLTAARTITLTIAVHAFTAGKATFFVEYVLGG